MNLFSLSKSFLIKSASKADELKYKYSNHIKTINLFNNKDSLKYKKFAKQEVKEENARANATGNIYNSERFSVIRTDDNDYIYSLNNTVFYFIIDKKAKPQKLMSKIVFKFIRNKNTNELIKLEVRNILDQKIKLEKVAEMLNDEYDIIINAINNDLEFLPKTELSNIEQETDYNKLIEVYNKYKGYDKVLSLLIKNKNLPKEIKLSLLNGKDEAIKIKLALNATDLETQKILAYNENENVRSALAKNTSIYLDVQRILANDYDEYVRSDLAGNPSIHLEIQKTLANNKNKYIREALAKNISLHSEVRNILINDEDKYVREALFNDQTKAYE